ncbi:MAG TPA: 30S ribosomal protein S4 [Thermoplasmata archaeon]|nr:30S ribosomal protein S4 [Thermoplasmata archaeon]
MGDPKFLRRRYDTPKHPWEGPRMEEERKLLERYGLKNKRELWKAQSVLRGFRRQARELQARLRAGEPQARRETDQLIGRLSRLGILGVGTPTLDDVLALSTEDILRRRLEWVVFSKGLAPTPKSARQWIVHGHVTVGDHRVRRPGTLLPSAEEARLDYTPSSPLADDGHALRVSLRERLERRGASPPSPPSVAEEARP